MKNRLSEINKRAWEIRKSSAAKFNCPVMQIMWGLCFNQAKEEIEMDIELDNMSVEDLKRLREKINEKINEKTPKTKVRVNLTPETNSGNRKGWFKEITAVDESKRNCYAFEGDFFQAGEQELNIGTVIIESIPCGSVRKSYNEGKIMIVTENGLENVDENDYEYDIKDEFLTLRDLAVKALNR